MHRICTAGNACVVCRGTRACPCARARELLARVPGALARACPTRARVQGPGTHACPCARARGHLRRGHSRECPCARAPTNLVPPTGWIDSVVQIQAPIVFLCTRRGTSGYTRRGTSFAPSRTWFNEIGTNLHVFNGCRYQNMNRLTRWCHFPLFFFLVTPFFCVKPRCLGMIK